tara:strand:+ start:1299 stop:1454 length:156 start_codon:yes stop_codon:yes gene_type:complete
VRVKAVAEAVENKEVEVVVQEKVVVKVVLVEVVLMAVVERKEVGKVDDYHK